MSRRLPAFCYSHKEARSRRDAQGKHTPASPSSSSSSSAAAAAAAAAAPCEARSSRKTRFF
ncbi:hypothetical protein JOB18_006688 [Solea senegalensis]|uniref:Uncharacterized protein n=1 Tax=Solea senegalensis TaxID=28829 RepID=A0AAV6S1U6_SOLSE|nr:hypothetical protein JOB18_006688 [Solea senegalensis]